jgi:hypothetical protein
MNLNLLRFSLLISLIFLVSGCGGDGGDDPSGVAQAQYGHGDSETDVTNAYGRGTVKPTPGQDFVHYESSITPWSGDYFPSNQTTLFQSSSLDQAPLQKYDSWVKEVHQEDSDATDFEKQYLYQPQADSAQGRCDAFAKASIMEAEPTTAVKVDGVNFTVGDQKALLVEAYSDADGFPTYGTRDRGDGREDPAEIYPDQFHRIIQAELIEKKMPFIIDKHVDGEVWNLPIYQADIRVQTDPGNPYVLHVTTYLGAAWYVTGQEDFVGTKLEVIDPAYTYDLYGLPQGDGGLEIYWGAWTGRSATIHPDFVVTRPQPSLVKLKSLNDQINVNYVEEIVTKARECRSDDSLSFCQ